MGPDELAAKLLAATGLPAARLTIGPGPARVDQWPFELKRPGACPPAVTVLPEAPGEVAAVVRFAAQSGVSTAVVGGRSNVVGAVERETALVLDLSGLTRVVSLDVESQLVTVEAGITGAALEEALAARGLTLGIYPQSLALATVGGWVATRATGTASAQYGGIERALCGATVVTPSGELLELPARVRPAGGLDALQLYCGSEGSLGVLVELTLSVHRTCPDSPLCAAFEDFAAGLACQRELLQRELPVSVVRLYNPAETRSLTGGSYGLAGRCLLLVTVAGPGRYAEAGIADTLEAIEYAGGEPVDPVAGERWFTHRYADADLMAGRNEGAGTVFDTIEVSVPWRSAAALAAAIESEIAPLCAQLFLHSSHAYRSGTCLYVMLFIQEATDADALARCREAWERTLILTERHAGAIGHHHGIGEVRRERYGASVDGRLHRLVKRALDPDGILRAPLVRD